jgi:hypothetical protein
MVTMTLAKLALLVAMYLALDLSNPMMPGALAFGVEETVEVVQSDRSRGDDHTPLVAFQTGSPTPGPGRPFRHAASPAGSNDAAYPAATDHPGAAVVARPRIALRRPLRVHRRLLA